MIGTTSSSTVTPAPTQEAIGSPAVIPDGTIVNPTSRGVIGTPEAADDTVPSYTIDESSVIEKEDGTTTTLGKTLGDVDALKKETAFLYADGSKYTGDVGYATIGDAANTSIIGLSQKVDSNKTKIDMVATAIRYLVARTADLSEDGTVYTGDVSGATVTPTGGTEATTPAAMAASLASVEALTVVAQPAPANLTAAPTMNDFNNLLSVLVSARVLK